VESAEAGPALKVNADSSTAEKVTPTSAVPASSATVRGRNVLRCDFTIPIPLSRAAAVPTPCARLPAGLIPRIDGIEGYCRNQSTRGICARGAHELHSLWRKRY
jgi:hypothetical protein